MIIIDGKMAGFDTISQLQQHNAYYRSASQIATGGALPELELLGEATPASELQR